jgi:hypothetical protein
MPATGSEGAATGAGMKHIRLLMYARRRNGEPGKQTMWARQLWACRRIFGPESLSPG